MSRVLRKFFSRQYKNSNDVWRDIRGISETITSPKAPRALKPRSSATAAILEIAPKFHSGTYDQKGIALEVLARSGKEQTPDNLKRTLVQVRNALVYAKRMGVLKPSFRPPLTKVVLPAEIRKHRSLVWLVLKRGHRFLPRDWRKYLSAKLAMRVGQEGLARALQKETPEGIAFSTFACGNIASRIKTEVKRAKSKERTTSEEREKKARLKTLSKDLDLLIKNGVAEPHHVGVYALRVLGHTPGQIALQVGSTRATIQSTFKDTIKLLEAAKASARQQKLALNANPVPVQPKAKAAPGPALPIAHVATESARYTSLNSILKRASEVSNAINVLPKKEQRWYKTPLKPLDSFHLTVAELAPKNRFGIAYSPLQVARRLLELKGKPADPQEEVKLAKKVRQAIVRLQRHGVLVKTSRLKRPKLRDALPAEVEQHSHLVQKVLRYGHKWLGQWRGIITPEQAEEAGKTGIVRAIETFDEDQHQRGIGFSNYLQAGAANAIRTLVRKTRGQRIISLDRQIRGQERTLHDVIGQPAFDPEILENRMETLLRLHRKGEVPAKHLEIFTLKHIFGHSNRELAQHYDIHEDTIGQILKRTMRKLNPTN